jgi:hypothetical protein
VFCLLSVFTATHGSSSSCQLSSSKEKETSYHTHSCLVFRQQVSHVFLSTRSESTVGYSTFTLDSGLAFDSALSLSLAIQYGLWIPSYTSHVNVYLKYIYEAPPTLSSLSSTCSTHTTHFIAYILQVIFTHAIELLHVQLLRALHR